MTKRQDLYLQRRSRSEQSDQRQPNQAKNISHQPRASPNSTPLTCRIEFPTMTGILPMLGVTMNATSEKAMTLLGWRPRSNEEAIVATAESLMRLGLLQS